MPFSYSAPVGKLLTYGTGTVRRRDAPWPDYSKLGLTEEHIPDLIRMATDMDLHNAKPQSREVWAGRHPRR